jgi:hypothetical protein
MMGAEYQNTSLQRCKDSDRSTAFTCIKSKASRAAGVIRVWIESDKDGEKEQQKAGF